MPHFTNSTINVVGIYYTGIYNNPELVKKICIGENVKLKREPANTHDKNAVSVCLFDSETHIGYIPRNLATRLAPVLDRGSDYKCNVAEIRGNRSQPQIIISLTTYPISPPESKPKSEPMPAPISKADPKSPKSYTPTGKPFRKIGVFHNHASKYDGVSGIYIIWNKEKKVYVGQSENVGKRWFQHRNELLARSHENKNLQADWIQMGADSFRFDLIEETASKYLDERERFYINKFDSYRSGYNTSHDGKGTPKIVFKGEYSGCEISSTSITEVENSNRVQKPEPFPSASPVLPEKQNSPEINSGFNNPNIKKETSVNLFFKEGNQSFKVPIHPALIFSIVIGIIVICGTFSNKDSDQNIRSIHPQSETVEHPPEQYGPIKKPEKRSETEEYTQKDTVEETTAGEGKNLVQLAEKRPNSVTAGQRYKQDMALLAKNQVGKILKAKETGREGRFIAYDDGTVFDIRTNLMWASKDNGKDVNWPAAKHYCGNFRAGGYTDWRMPTLDELSQLYDISKSGNLTYFIHLSGWIWTSETHGSKASNFFFGSGRSFWHPMESYYNGRALPVRPRE